MKQAKRLLALLLALVLCTALLPAALAEEEGTIAPVTDPAEDEPLDLPPSDDAGVIAPVTGAETDEPEALPPADGTGEVYSGSCGDNVTWTLDTNSHSLTPYTLTISGTGAMDDYNIVSSVPWKDYQEDIWTIVIGEGVTYVGKNAFYGCESCSTVVLPYSLNSVGMYAFQRTALSEVCFPSGVTEIQSGAFDNCENLERIVFLGAVPAIASSAFRNVTATAFYPEEDETWTEAVLQPYGGTLTWESLATSGQCGDAVYWSLNRDTGAMFIYGSGPMWDFELDWDTWYYNMPWEPFCYEITELVMERGVTSLGDYSFLWCSKLSNVILPNTLTRIGYEALAGGCFTEIDLPYSLETIEEEAFKFTALKKLTVPEAVTEIGKDAFCGCYDLQWLRFAGSAPALGDRIFLFLSDPFYVFYPYGDESWTPELLQDYHGSPCWEACLDCGFCGDEADWFVTVDGAGEYGILILGEGDMYDYSYDSVNYCGDTPWSPYIEELASLRVGEGVTSLGKESFDGTYDLRRVSLPESLTRIGKYALWDGDFQSIVLPANLSRIDDYAIGACSVKHIVFTGAAPAIGDNSFYDVTATAYYPGEDASWTAEVRKNYGGTITWKTDGEADKCGDSVYWELADGVLFIWGEGPMWDFKHDYNTNTYNSPWFADRDQIRRVVVDEGVTTVGQLAFRLFPSLTDVTLPAGLTRIRPSAFHGCEALARVNLPEGLERIDYAAFSECRSLTTVTLPSSLRYIDESAFHICTSLTGVTIPAGVNYIGPDAFNSNESMTRIDVDPANAVYSSLDGVLFNKDRTTLITYPAGKTGEYAVPEGVEIIEDFAFYNAKGLTNLSFPESLTRIGRYAFFQCRGLDGKSVTFPAAVEYIGSSAFAWIFLSEIRFLGSAPEIGADAFELAEATAYYPAYDPSWTEEVRQDYGGELTWEADYSACNAFADVKSGKYYFIPVYWAYYHDPQITAGTDESHFSPNKTCTREQIVTFLWNAMGRPEPTLSVNPFTDVKSGKYYYKAVMWAVQEGITGGVGDGKFGVGQPCTREQAMTFLWKACGSPAPEGGANPFTDVKEGKYYYDAVQWAVQKGVTGGMSETLFGVGKTCTRGQIVTFLYAARDFLGA